MDSETWTVVVVYVKLFEIYMVLHVLQKIYLQKTG